MNIILCEGKRDAWFFREIMREYIDISRIYCIPYNGMDKLQAALGSSCFSYMNSQYSLMIYGDNGKPVIIEKVLQRVVVDTLGKVREDIHITMILDDDGVSYDELYGLILNKLQFISKDKSKFNPLPDFEENNGLFILYHPKSKGGLKIKLSTVPGNLEEHLAKKIVEVKQPHDFKILKNGAKKALNLLTKEYYSSEEEMIREASILLKDEEWVKNISTVCLAS